MHELYILNKSLSFNLYILILLESKSYILIHHTFLLVHGTTGRCMFKSCFLHLVFIKIYLIILNSYDIVITGYMHTMIACVS